MKNENSLFPEDLHVTGLPHDLKRWQEEIELVNVELIFFRNLVTTHHKEQSTWNESDYQNLFNSIKDVQHYNQSFQRRFLSFSNELTKLDECLDLQCETHFARNYTHFKKEIEEHFSRYKQFKKNLFTFLRTRYNY